MKKIEKMIHQIIRFRGNIEAFLVSIEEFSRSNFLTESQQCLHVLDEAQPAARVLVPLCAPLGRGEGPRPLELVGDGLQTLHQRLHIRLPRWLLQNSPQLPGSRDSIPATCSC